MGKVNINRKVTVITRAGTYAYRFSGDEPGKYHSTGIKVGSSDDAEERAIAYAEWAHSRRTGEFDRRTLLREYAKIFYGPDCPHLKARYLEAPARKDITGPMSVVTERVRVRMVSLIKNKMLDRLSIMSLPLALIREEDFADAKAQIIDLYGKSRTAQQVFGVLRIMMEEAWKKKMIKGDVALWFKTYKRWSVEDIRERNAMTGAQRDQFMRRENFASDLEFAVFKFTYLTGMRRGEVLRFDWPHWLRPGHPKYQPGEAERLYVEFAWKNERFTISGPPKNGKPRTIYVTKELHDHLEWWEGVVRARDPFNHEPLRGLMFEGSRPNRPPSAMWWKRTFREATSKAKVGDYVPHELRHTRASDLVTYGLGEDMVRSMFGWQNWDMVANYAHLDADRQREAFEKADKRRQA